MQRRTDRQIGSPARGLRRAIDQQIISDLRGLQPGVGKREQRILRGRGGLVVNDGEADDKCRKGVVVAELVREIFLRIQSDGATDAPAVIQRVAEDDQYLTAARRFDRVQQVTDFASVAAGVPSPAGVNS